MWESQVLLGARLAAVVLSAWWPLLLWEVVWPHPGDLLRGQGEVCAGQSDFSSGTPLSLLLLLGGQSDLGTCPLPLCLLFWPDFSCPYFPVGSSWALT